MAVAACKAKMRCVVGDKSTRAKAKGGGNYYFVTLIGMGWSSQVMVKEELYNVVPPVNAEVEVIGLFKCIKAKVKRGASEMEADVFELEVESWVAPNPGGPPKTQSKE